MLVAALVPVLLAWTTVSVAYRAPSVPWLPTPTLDLRAPQPKLVATKTQMQARDLTVAARQETCPPQPLPSGICTCPGQMYCDGTCVDLDTDNKNCGSCGTECYANEACIAGECQCAPGSNECFPGICTDFQTDPENCGSCGNSCYGLAPTCIKGKCSCPNPGETSCPAGYQPFCCDAQYTGTPVANATLSDGHSLAIRSVVDVDPDVVTKLKYLAAKHGLKFEQDALGGISCTALPTDRCLNARDCAARPACCQQSYEGGMFTFKCTPAQ